jgi:hypothetical protein
MLAAGGRQAIEPDNNTVLRLPVPFLGELRSEGLSRNTHASREQWER